MVPFFIQLAIQQEYHYYVINLIMWLSVYSQKKVFCCKFNILIQRIRLTIGQHLFNQWSNKRQTIVWTNDNPPTPLTHSYMIHLSKNYVLNIRISSIHQLICLHIIFWFVSFIGYYLWGILEGICGAIGGILPEMLSGLPADYRKTSNISRTSVGNKIVDNSDVVGASPVGAAPTTSSCTT